MSDILREYLLQFALSFVKLVVLVLKGHLYMPLFALSVGLAFGAAATLIPKRLFQDPMYKPIPYGFLVGALAPLVIWLLHRKFKRPKFDLWYAPPRLRAV
ncbi:hypothetical protein DFH09DRAFT_1334297 [Mycena vulgaris]|nr:hypothetical protein DFH09DRAFT_1334297 [Mycena vulgaris]